MPIDWLIDLGASSLPSTRARRRQREPVLPASGAVPRVDDGNDVGRGAIGVTAGSEEVIGVGPGARRMDGFARIFGLRAFDLDLRSGFFVARRLALAWTLTLRAGAAFFRRFATVFAFLFFAMSSSRWGPLQSGITR